MARHILILCPCGQRKSVDPAPYTTSLVGEEGKRVEVQGDSEPQTVPCCQYEYRVVWHYINREPDAAKRRHRTKRGMVPLISGARATVRVYKDGALVGAWGWVNDRFQRGKINIHRAVRDHDAQRLEREAELAAALVDPSAPKGVTVEGPSFDKHTRKPLAQASSKASAARELRDEINRLDGVTAGSKVEVARPFGRDPRVVSTSPLTVNVIAYPE